MNASKGRVLAPALVIGCSLIFLALGVHYALIQNVWIDESTQLSGATLPLGRLFAWLAGAPEPGFGVPADRMPPISYLIDAACQRTFCTAPESYRLLHLLIATLGVAALIDLIVRRYGLISGMVTGGVLIFSPKLVEAGVEIRAYPIFFTLTCLQIRQVYALIDAERLDARRLAGFVVVALLTIYTHFFGLVSTMAFLTALVLCRASDRREALILIAAGLLLLVLSIGLAPFITGARAISGVQAEVSAGIGQFTLYLFRLLGSPANVLSPLAASLYFAAWLGLAAVGVTRLWRAFARGGIGARRAPGFALAVALAAGLIVTLAASFVVHGFNPLKPSYSIWVLPVMAALAGALCATIATQADRFVAVIAIMLLASSVWAQAMLTLHSGWFVHGPSRAIWAAVGDDPSQTAVIYQGAWGYGYFPTYYRYHDRLDQYWAAPDGRLLQIKPGRDPVPADLGRLATKRHIVAVNITLRDYGSLQDVLHHRSDPAALVAARVQLPDLPTLRGLPEATHTSLPGLYWADIVTFERSTP